MESGGVNTSEVEEGVGRLNFVAGILDHPRPWLSPLYAFLATTTRNTIVTLPPYVHMALLYLERAFLTTRLVPCARSLRPHSSALRVDAHAEGTSVGVGAWLPHVDSAGNVIKELSPWLSVALTPEDTPWAFAREGSAFRVIASLEAYAVLLGIKHLVPDLASDESWAHLSVVPALTDNQGNGRVLSKMFTTRHPLAAVVMELAEEMGHRGLVADVSWVPRDANEEADALSRGVTTGFSAERRVVVDPARLSWYILPDALRWGEQLKQATDARKSEGAPTGARARRHGRKRARHERLKARDPW